MRWSTKPKPPYDPEAEHLWFAWWPTKVSDDAVIWLEWIWRREVCGIDGGAYFRFWIYRFNEIGAKEWRSPVSYS